MPRIFSAKGLSIKGKFSIVEENQESQKKERLFYFLMSHALMRQSNFEHIYDILIYEMTRSSLEKIPEMMRDQVLMKSQSLYELGFLAEYDAYSKLQSAFLRTELLVRDHIELVLTTFMTESDRPIADLEGLYECMEMIFGFTSDEFSDYLIEKIELEGISFKLSVIDEGFYDEDRKRAA
jgi:hypothetical protein